MLLALKYRPLFFKDVLGQDASIQVLKENVKSKKLRPVYMFVGPYGSGKTTLARIFSRAIMCPDQQDGEPCNQCESCKSHIEGKNLNFIEIDAATHGRIDNVRQLKDEASYVPLGASRFKVICLDECHEMKKAAQNALLKQMEEAPETTVYVLCTTEPEKMLKTVTSRSWVFPIKRIPYKKIADRLEHICSEEHVVYEREALDLIVETEKGHVRDAIGKVDLLSTYGEITADLVREVLDLDLDDHFLEILKNLRESIAQSIETAERVLDRIEPYEIYNGLARKCVEIFRSGLYSKIPERYVEIHEAIGFDLVKVADYFLNRSRRVDKTTLFCDLLVVNSKLNNGFEEVKFVKGMQPISRPSSGPRSPTSVKSFDDQFKTDLDRIGSKPPEHEKKKEEQNDKSLSKRFEILSSKKFSMLLVGKLKEWPREEDGSP